MQAESFFRSLFDYSFSSFVTPRIIKILYVLATIVISLWTLFLVLAGFNVSSTAGLLMLIIVGPLFFVVSMIYARVVLELVIVFFRINGNVQEIRDERIGGAPQPAPAPEPPAAPAPGLGAGTPALDVPSVAPTAIEQGPQAPTPPETSSVPEQDPPSPSVRYCENCGAERRPDSRFCTSCGHA
jgi:hypothetical protein